MVNFTTFSKMINHARTAMLVTTNLLSEDNTRETQASNQESKDSDPSCNQTSRTVLLLGSMKFKVMG